MEKRLMVDISTVAQYLNVSKNTIYSWVYQRKIPHIKVGSLLKFDIHEINKWLTEHKRDIDQG